MPHVIILRNRVLTVGAMVLNTIRIVWSIVVGVRMSCEMKFGKCGTRVCLSLLAAAFIAVAPKRFEALRNFGSQLTQPPSRWFTFQIPARSFASMTIQVIRTVIGWLYSNLLHSLSFVSRSWFNVFFNTQKVVVNRWVSQVMLNTLGGFVNMMREGF